MFLPSESPPQSGGRFILQHALSALLLLAMVEPAGCARSVNDYLAEARSNEPGAVKDAVVAIGDILYRKESAGLAFDEVDREALLYVKEVASKNTVPVNRAVAVNELGRLSTVDSKEVFLGALKDPFWLVRFQAVSAIESHPDPSFAEPLRDLLLAETRPEVKLAVVKALTRIKGELALRTLLEVFLKGGDAGRSAPQVHAYTAIREMTGLAYGFEELNDWQKYYRERYGAPAPEGTEPRAIPIEARRPVGGEQGTGR